MDGTWREIDSYSPMRDGYVLIKFVYLEGTSNERLLEIPVIAKKEKENGKDMWVPNYGPVRDYKFFNEKCTAKWWMPYPKFTQTDKK